MPRHHPSSLVIVAVTLIACRTPRPDLAADREALLRLHAEQRSAHLDRQASRLTGTFADTFYSISRGRVTTPSRDESTQRFEAYFDQASFRRWDDIAPPLLRISPDGNMAYVIVQKRVTLAPRDSSRPIEDVIYAWMSTYEKQDGRWRLTALASTERPAASSD